MRLFKESEGKLRALSISKLQDKMGLDIFPLKDVKTLVHFLPSLFKQKLKINSPQICCAFKVHLKGSIGFPGVSLSFYKYLPA